MQDGDENLNTPASPMYKMVRNRTTRHGELLPLILSDWKALVNERGVTQTMIVVLRVTVPVVE